ncbi:hypothetical protein BSK57_03805 [Paenibacillus odorifer]|nr:hypothetical protein BSK57_03805 [Paenibacillus odorifer]
MIFYQNRKKTPIETSIGVSDFSCYSKNSKEYGVLDTFLSKISDFKTKHARMGVVNMKIKPEENFKLTTKEGKITAVSVINLNNSVTIHECYKKRQLCLS